MFPQKPEEGSNPLKLVTDVSEPSIFIAARKCLRLGSVIRNKDISSSVLDDE